MNLHELRTPQPLRDSDFAAIRARVKAEIAQREERPWPAILLRFAFAASLLVLFVPLAKDRAPQVPVERTARVERPAELRSAERGDAERRLPAGRSAGILPARAREEPGRLEASGAAGRMPALRVPALRGPALRAAAPIQQATRIEIITADTTIRIIWLTPKENS